MRGSCLLPACGLLDNRDKCILRASVLPLCVRRIRASPRILLSFFNTTIPHASLPFLHIFESIRRFLVEKDFFCGEESVKAQWNVIVAFMEEMHRGMGTHKEHLI